jgi:Spy/CpxP family protein refolding chaperone
MDDFEGLTYSDEQKAQIRKVHEQSVSRLTLVSRDPKLNDDQKGAMLQGYMRMEYTEIFKLLTPEQQAEVRKKIAARREQENRDKKKAQPAHATRPPHP